jgi:DNA-binding NarL/FixJ family response regulator
MPGISVLVVDDHILFADALQARLAREPDLDPVSVAYHARDAIDEVARTRPAVVILDVVLDDGCGLDLIEKMRETSPDSKIVMLTVVESVDDVVTALSRGARAWLPKTIDTNNLVRVIRGVNRGGVWLAPELLGRVLTDLAAGPHTTGQLKYRALRPVSAWCCRRRLMG